MTEKKILTANIGVVDPESIDEYIGRGGAAFPTSVKHELTAQALYLVTTESK